MRIAGAELGQFGEPDVQARAPLGASCALLDQFREPHVGLRTCLEESSESRGRSLLWAPERLSPG